MADAVRALVVPDYRGGTTLYGRLDSGKDMTLLPAGGLNAPTVGVPFVHARESYQVRAVCFGGRPVGRRRRATGSWGRRLRSTPGGASGGRAVRKARFRRWGMPP